MATLHQFPNKMQTPTHCVRNGEVWYVWKIKYTFGDTSEFFYMWGRDEQDARARLTTLKANAEFIGRLKDEVEEDIKP